MKTIISRGLAWFLIGTAFLACASPIAFDPKTLAQHNSLISANSIGTNAPSDVERAVDAELSDPTRLTRRRLRRYPVSIPAKPVPVVIQTHPLPVPEINYDTPLEFINSLNARQTIARRVRIELWKSMGVKDLEVMVDSLKKFDFPMWLIHECEDRIDHELEWSHLFWHQEARQSYYLTTISQHAKDILRLKAKLPARQPSPISVADTPLSPSYEDSEEEYSEYSSDECESQEPENQIHGEHGNPSPSPSPKKDSAEGDPPDIPPNVIGSTVNELHTKARRERIDQWDVRGVKPLMEKVEKLPASGFPSWLVWQDYDYEILQTRVLIEKFEKVETSEVYLSKMKEHKTAINHVGEKLYKMIDKDFDDHLQKLIPKIREGGRWRKVVKELADQVKDLHWYSNTKSLAAEIHAGLEIFQKVKQSPRTNKRPVEMKNFKQFLCRQRDRVKEAKAKFDADQPGIDPTSTQSS